MGRNVALVGRDDTLDLLESEIASIGSGAFRVVLVAGPAGVGKTRLVAEGMKQQESGTVLMSARSFRWGGTTSFGPWVEALDRHLRGLPEDEIRRLCGPARNDLAAILTSVQAETDGPWPEPDRGRLLDALAHLINSLSRESTVLMAFDDLHLADTSAWEALRYLGRRLETAPVGVLATARSAQLRSRPTSREVLVGLEDDGLLTRIDLPPLTRSEVTALAYEVLRADPSVPSAFVPEPLVDWLMKRSLGHPLFVIGLLRALTEEGADLTEPRLERIPHKVGERVALDLHALDPNHREVLETLAVLDQRCDLDQLLSLTGRSVQELGVVLESLSRAQLVSEQGSGLDLRYEIAHPIIQDVVYEEIGSARRADLHGKAARMMAGSGQLGAAASHYALAGARDEEAVDALFLAMRQAGERDLYQEALAVLNTLLQVLPRGDPRWIRVLESVTLESEWVISHLAESEAGVAIEAMNRVIEVLEGSDDLSAQALARFHLATFLSFGEAGLDEAEEVCSEAVELFRKAGDIHGELVSSNELAWISGGSGDFASQADIALDVLMRAEGEGLSHVAAVAAGAAAFAHGVMGRFDRAGDLFERALELAWEAEVTYRVAWAHAQGGLYYHALIGQLEEAVAWGQQALEDDPAAPDTVAYEDLGASYWLQGRLQESAAMLERSSVRRPILGSRRRAWGSALAARVYAESGQWSRAVPSLERATSTYHDDWFLIWSAWTNWARGVLAWMEGEARTGLAELTGLADWLQDVGALGFEPLVLNDVTEIAADIRAIDECQPASMRCSEVAEIIRAPLASWLASLSSARLHLVSGEYEAAAEQASEAAAGFDQAGYSLFAASAREVLGRAQAETDRPAATATLQQAAHDFDACGAVWRRDRALATLNELGSRGRRAAAAVQGPTSLTAREREVAALTARGHTAHEVGEKLFIGKRTVETHLANIYAKLGITSKRDLIQRGEDWL